METIPKEIEARAYQICYDYLGGVWRNSPQYEIIIEKMSGGYANLTLKISLPSNYKPVKDEPLQVIMKIHLDMLGEGHFRLMTENVIAVILSQRNLAPKVYGIFDGGRLDEFVLSRPLCNKDLRNHDIIGAIMRKLAHLHTMNLPINKDPNKWYNQLKHFIDLALNDLRNKDDPKRKGILHHLTSENPYAEVKWLGEIIESINSPVMYCHGDLQPNNILLRIDSPNDPIHIIDLDLSGYNYRGADFASLAVGFCFEVPYPDPPYYKMHWDLYPSKEEQKCYISVYLQETGTLDVKKEEEKILKETEVFTLFYFYYVYALLACKKDESLTNKIDSIEGAGLLLDRYKYLKNEFLKT